MAASGAGPVIVSHLQLRERRGERRSHLSSWLAWWHPQRRVGVLTPRAWECDGIWGKCRERRSPVGLKSKGQCGNKQKPTDEKAKVRHPELSLTGGRWRASGR